MNKKSYSIFHGIVFHQGQRPFVIEFSLHRQYSAAIHNKY